MKWQGRQGSGNIEDRRGMGMGAVSVGGGLGGLILLLIISALTGTNPLDLIGVMPETQQEQSSGTTGLRENDAQAQFISVVLADTEDTWREVFRERGEAYVPPILVLFDGATQSACGVGRAEVGPFYCPVDRKVY